jgi:hypothetical protein
MVKMNKLVLSIVFALVSFVSFSQKVYFIYLQSETEQPFSIKLNSKIHSSTPSGYLILSKLHDSTYSFTVVFPQNKWPEQTFSIAVNKKDHGFLLKNFGEKGWGLFDLNNLSVIQANALSINTLNPVITERKEGSGFTELLSKAVDDPTLKEKQILQNPEEKKVEKAATGEVKKESDVSIKDTVMSKPLIVETSPVIFEEPKPMISNAEVIKADSILVPDIAYSKSVVTKKSESSTTEGFGLVYLDEFGNGIKDTIRLLILNPQPVKILVTEIPKEEKKFIENITSDTLKMEENVKVEAKQLVKDSLINNLEKINNCKILADDSDFFKLRKSMAAIEGEDEMINEAKKYFKVKCFKTIQIRNLSTLFLSEEGKYRFFDAAYFYTTDKENFNALQSELKDEYFINRFKAMLRN